MTAPVLPLITKITIDSKKMVKNRLLQSQFGNGFIQVAKDGLNSNIDQWTINYAPLRSAELTTLEAFLTTVGCDIWFTWIPIGETISKKWRIDKDSLQRNMVSTAVYRISFTMTQVFNLGT